jgi:hypothetical protein
MTTCWGAPRRAYELPQAGSRDVIVVVIALGAQPRLAVRLARKLADPVLRRQKDERMSDGTCFR